MNAYEFNKFLDKLSEGIYDVLEKKGLITELTEKNQNDKHFFAPNLSKLVQKELMWVNTDYDTKHDIVLEAFSNILLQRDPFKSYTRKGEKGHKANIEAYLNLMFQRELSRLSQARIKKFDKEYNEGDIYGLGDESNSEAFERVINQYTDQLDKEFTPQEEEEFDELMKEVKKRLSKKQNFDIFYLIIDSLFIGLSKSEIAKLLGVSSAKISQRLKVIKDIILDIANERKEEGDDDLLKMYNKYVNANTSGIRNPLKDKNQIKSVLVTAGVSFNL
jgi:DNA-directed RNA polymerase specialized sigma24 family protein